MEDKVSAPRVSRRWDGPTFDAEGNHWTARLRSPLTPSEVRAGLEPAVFGPDAYACAREARRQDRRWAELPLISGDREGARRRLAYLAGGEAE